MSFDSVIKRLAETQALVSALADEPTLSVEITRESAQKLLWLKDADRDFFKVTPKLRGAVRRAYNKAIRERRTVARAHREAGEAAKELILERLRTSGGDVSMRPLTRGWKDYKLSHGMSVLIGRATGDLYRELVSKPFVFR